jgi:hypothetical protein
LGDSVDSQGGGNAVGAWIMDKWTLFIGCHRGTLISRDVADPEKYDTEEEALTAYRAHKDFYRSIGYHVWFAHIKSPEGVERTLEQNSYIG